MLASSTRRMIETPTVRLTFGAKPIPNPARPRRRVATTGATAAPSVIADPRIEHRIDDVGEEIDEDHQKSEDQRDALDHRIVTGRDRAHDQRTNARNAEHRF